MQDYDNNNTSDKPSKSKPTNSADSSADFWEDLLREIEDKNSDENVGQLEKDIALSGSLKEDVGRSDKKTDNEELLISSNDDMIKNIDEVSKSVTSLRRAMSSDGTETRKIISGIENSLMMFKSEIEDNVDRLSDLFEQRISEDETKDKAFEELYSQLNMYKSDFMKSLLKPFITDLLLFYDRILNNISHLEDDNRDILYPVLSMFKDELLEILLRNGIEPIEKSIEGEKFNPEKSKVIKKEFTDDIDKDMTIFEVVNEGFYQDGKLLRPESVVIYKYNSKQ